MNKTIILKTFLIQFQEFLESVVELFPNDREIISTKVYFEGLKRMNPKLLITSWKILITDRYGNEIENEDFEWLINKNYSEDTEYYAKSNNKVPEDYRAINDKIEELKDQLNKLSDNNKKCSMKYINNLTKLSKIYSEN